jgi:hypothetical protein
MVPGSPYSIVVALETGRSSWTAPLDAVRLTPGDDAAMVTGEQLRRVVTSLIAAGHWQPDDPDVLIVADAGYDGPRLAFLLADLPVAVLVRMRSDRVLRRPAPPLSDPKTGVAVAIPASISTSARSTCFGRRSCLRRFDIEHTFRLLKQTLGWTCPKLRTPEAADRWTWLILAAYTQLRLARQLAADLRRAWEKPAYPHRLTPARVRRGFRHLRRQTAGPASAPKPSRPGPGRPPGRRNRRPTDRHDVHIVTRTTDKPPKSRIPRPRRTG